MSKPTRPHSEPLEPRRLFAGDFGFAFGLDNVPVNATTTDFGQAVATDAAGNVYVAGAFGGVVDFNPSSSAKAEMRSAGDRDAYVAKYSPTGAYLWAVRVGGKGFDGASAIAIDNAGRVVVGGSFTGDGKTAIDFNPAKGKAATLVGRGKSDGFVLTLDANGKFLRVADLGGKGNDFVDHLGTDAAGNVYAMGTFAATAKFGKKSLTTAFLDDSYAVKLSAAGVVQWATVVGGPRTKAGTSDGRVFDAAIAPDGTFAITGAFIGTVDFKPGKKKFNLTSSGAKTDVYVAKYDAGGALVWARGVGGSGDDVARGVAIDSSGNVVTTGTFTKTVDFDPGAGGAKLTSSGTGTPAGAEGTIPQEDAFVYKLNSAGNYVWARRVGAVAAYEEGTAVRTDAQGNVYVAGAFEKKADFDPGASTAEIDEAADGIGSLYVLKLSAAGNFTYARAAVAKAKTAAFVFPTSIALDPSGDPVVTGSFIGSVDFDPGPATATRTGSARQADIFLLKLLA